MMNLSTLFLCCCLLLLACPTHAQNCACTVEEVNSNSVAPCDIVIGDVVTVNSATSFRNAINQANANGGNMTILIEDGTYHVATTASYPYIAASNLVIRSASGNRDMVILHGDGMKDVSPNTENGLGVAGKNVVIADLTIRDIGNHGIQVSGHNLYVHNVRIQDAYQQMLKGTTAAASIDSAIVQCSLFEYTSGIGPNYYIGGLDIHKGRNWTVRDNIFRNIISPSGSVAEHAIHFWNNSMNNTIERNQIVNCDRGIGFGLGSSPNTGGVIKNNMIYNDGSGSFSDVGIGLESSPGTLVFNNTVYVDYQNAIEYRFAATNGVEIINNLTNKPITSRDGGQAMLANNITNAQSVWFEDINDGDLHLASAIPVVVDQGSDLSDVQDDIDQTARPKGAGYDIGAHELMTTSIKSNSIRSLVKIFPNPNHGRFTIEAREIDRNLSPDIEIYNTFGQKIFIGRFPEEKFFVEINISMFEKGMYIVKIRAEEQIQIAKMTVQ